MCCERHLASRRDHSSSLQAPGGSVSEVFAKLEVYMWLGLAKYSKEATNNLPDEFQPVFEEEDEEQKRLIPAGLRQLPVSLSCQGESTGLEVAWKWPLSLR